MLHECPCGPAKLWRDVCNEWEHATGEKLNPTSKKITLLGDRKEHPKKQHATVIRFEPAFRLMHACVLHTLVRDMNRLNHDKAASPKVTTSEALYAKARDLLRHTLKTEFQQKRESTSAWKFTEEWFDSGFASLRQGGLRVHLMSGSANSRLLTCDRAGKPGHYWCYTDGAGPTQPKSQAAGAGAALFEAIATTPEAIQSRAELVLGPVGKEYGASTGSNNAGELLGLGLGIDMAQKKLRQGETITFRTDSALSLRLLLGKRRNKSRSLISINARLVKNIRLKLSLLRKRLGYGKVHFQKVRGHSGDAWNDLADALAAFGRDGYSDEHAPKKAALAALRRKPPEDVT